MGIVLTHSFYLKTVFLSKHWLRRQTVETLRPNEYSLELIILKIQWVHAAAAPAKLLQSCPTLSYLENPKDSRAWWAAIYGCMLTHLNHVCLFEHL